MKKFNNLVAVILLVGNIFVQPIISIQQVFAQDDASESIITEESVPEIVSQEAPVVETVEEAPSEDVVEPPSEEITPPVSEEVEVPVDDTSSDESEDVSETDEVSEESSESEENSEEESDEESDEEEKEAVTSIVYNNSNNTTSNLRTGSKARYSFTVTNSEAALADATLRLTLTGDAIEAFASNEDYFPGKGYGSLVNAYYSNGNFIVDYAIGELSADFNRNFDFEFKTIDDRSMTNGQQVLVKAEVIKTDQSVLASSGPEYYSFVTRQPQFRTNVTYPTEGAASDDDSEPAQQTTLIDFFFSMGTEGQGNGSGRSAVTTISVAVNVPASLEFDAIANDGWSYDEASRVATYTFAPDATIFDTELSLPKGLVLISNGETVAETINASATFAFVNGQIVEKTNAPEVMMMATADFGISAVNSNPIQSFAFSYQIGETWFAAQNGVPIEVKPSEIDSTRLEYNLLFDDADVINDGDTYTFNLPNLVSPFVPTPGPVLFTDATKDDIYYTVNDTGLVTITFPTGWETGDDRKLKLELYQEFNVDLFEDERRQQFDVPISQNDAFVVIFEGIPEEFQGADYKIAQKSYVVDESGNVTNDNTKVNANRADWKIRVNDRLGTFDSVTVSDTLNGGHTLDADSIKVYLVPRNKMTGESTGDRVDVTSQFIPNSSTGSFTIDFGAIDDTYEIEYTTIITQEEPGSANTTISNLAEIDYGRGPTDHKDDIELEWPATAIPIIKEGIVSNDPSIINWKVYYNYSKDNLGNVTFIDSLSNGEVDLTSVRVWEVPSPQPGNRDPWSGGAFEIAKPTASINDDGDMTFSIPDSDGKAYYVEFNSFVEGGLNEEVVTNTIDDLNPDTDPGTGSVTVSTPVGNATKDGTVKYNEDTPYIEWIVTFNTNRVKFDGFSFSDTFDTNLLVLDSDSLVLKADGIVVDESLYDVTSTNGGFDFTLPVSERKVYTLTYRTDYTEAGLAVEKVTNSVDLDWDDEGVGPSDEVGHPKAGIKKSVKFEVGEDATGKARQEIEWLVAFNTNNLVLETPKLSDRFSPAELEIVGNIEIFTIIDDLEVPVTSGFSIDYVAADTEANTKGYNIVFDEDTLPTTYYVRYRTTLPAANTGANNTATLSWQGYQEADSTKVNVPKNEPGVSKDGTVVRKEDGSAKQIDWKINFNTNKRIIENLVITDKYTPEDTVLIDDIKIAKVDGNIALVEGTDYDITEAFGGGSFEITFLDQTEPVEYVLTYSTEYNAYFDNVIATNKATVKFNGGEQEADKTIIPVELNVSKASTGVDTTVKPAVISWTITANSNLKTLQDAILVDTIEDDQEYVEGSMKFGETDANPTWNGNEFTVELPDGANAHTLTYQTKIVKYPSNYGTINDEYHNKVELINYSKATEGDGIFERVDDEATARYYKGEDNNNPAKSGYQDTDTDLIVWTATINPDAQPIKNARIRDILDGNQVYFLKEDGTIDLVVERVTSAGNVVVPASEYEVTPSEVNGIPQFELRFNGSGLETADEINHAYQLTYKTSLREKIIGQREVKNTIKIVGSDGTSVIEEGSNGSLASKWYFGGSGSDQTLSVKVVKVDKDNNELVLPGVQFKLTNVRATDIVHYLTTNSLGEIDVTGLRAGRYMLEEVAPLTGYQSIDPIYFFLGYGENQTARIQLTNNAWSVDNLVDIDNAQINVVNEKIKSSITASKIWQGGPTDTLPEAYLQLFRKAYGQSEEAVGDKQLVSGSANVSVEWTGLDLFTSTGLPYEFYVKEVDADGNVFTPAGYTSQYAKNESGMNEDRLTIVNTNAETTEYTVTKIWTDYSNDFGTRPTDIAIYLQQNGNNYDFALVDATFATADDDVWQYTFTDLPKYDENGSEYTYTVHEVVQSPYTHEIDQETLTITNTFVNSETVEFSGQKVWNDYDNEAGFRPETILVTLLQNDIVYADVEAALVSENELGIWSYSFTDLPKYDEAGAEYRYSVQEILADELEGVYSSEMIGNNIVNTIAPDKVTTSIQGEKIWNDFNNGPGNRPDSIQVNLLQNGVKIDDDVISADTDGKWYYSFANLVKYDENNVEYSYTVEEAVNEASDEEKDAEWPNYYDSIIDGTDIINTYSVPEDSVVAIQGRKVWNDYNNQFETRPTSVLMILYQNDKVLEYLPVSADVDGDANAWSFEFTGLAKYDAEGNEYVYRVEELVNVPYTSVKTGSEEEAVIFTNTYVNKDVVDYTGNKVWTDYNNAYNLRPSEVTINLYQTIEGEEAGDPLSSTTATAANNWTYVFEDLDKYDAEGNEYIYTVDEVAIPGYDTEIYGSTIVNTLQTTEVSGVKTWSDFDNQYNTRPAFITVNLLQATEGSEDSAVIFASKRVAAIDDWAYSFTDLPVVDGEGNAYRYSIEEEELKGYISTVVDTNITNELVKQDVSGEKVWIGTDNPYTTHPEVITVNLVQTIEGSSNSVVLASQDVTAANDWVFEFLDVPVYDLNGNKYIYTVTENVVPGYTTDIAFVDGIFKVTNSLITVDLAGTKTWDDWFGTEAYDNQLSSRPENITVNLLQNGVQITDQVVEPDEDNNWSYVFDNLPKFDANGVEYQYTVEEVSVDNYETETNGKDITNTYLNTETIDLPVVKVWVDYSDKHDTRPENVALLLFRNDETVAYRTVLLTDDGNGDDTWLYTFTDLPKYDEAGEAYSYRVDEVVTSPYTKVVEGSTITNTYISTETVDYQGQKVWNDYDNEFDTRPEDITVTLYQNDVAMDGEEFTQTVTPNAAGNWNFSFTDLPKHDAAGDEYVYTVREVTVDGYETSYDGNFIINKVDPLDTVVAGQKFWDDYDNAFETRPESITVNLFQNGEFYKSTSVTEADDWYYSFTDIPMHDADGELYVYTVEEELSDEAAEFYTSVVDGNNIYNTYVNTETVDINGQKVWNDYNNQFKTRPSSILLVLYRNGVEQSVKQVDTVAGNVWEFSITDLPKYDEAGIAYVYEVKELTSAPYTSETVVDEDGLVTFTNTYVNTEVTALSGSKVWEDFDDYYGLRPTSIEVVLYQNGEAFDSKVVDLDRLGNMRYSFTELPKYDELGALFNYSVGDDVHAYDMENYYDDLINTLVTIDVEGTKTWDDFDDVYGLRPATIQINLNQTIDGSDETVVLHSTEISANENWHYAFNDVPQFDAAGNEYIYTITEEAIEDQPMGAYDVDSDGYDLINHLITTEVPVTKSWHDFEDAYGLRPEAITFNLLQDDELFASETVTAAENWSHIFENLPQYNVAGEEYVYTVTEDAVYAYSTEITDYVVSNTLITRDIEGTKAWNDQDDFYALRPEAITVNLVQGIETSTETRVLKTLQVTADTDWTFEFSDVPVYDAAGNEYIYTLTEEVNEAYDVDIDNETYLITNSLKVTDVEGNKVWLDYDNGFGLRPEAITVRLHQTLTGSVTSVELFDQVVTADTDWAFIFTDLPVVNAEGVEYIYTVTEDTVNAYETTIEDTVITNDLITIPISGLKVWNDYNDKFEHRPDFITVNLLQNGELLQAIEVTADEDGVWSYSFGQVPEFDAEGQAYVYTVTEEAVAEYNEAEINGTIITNTYVNTEVTSVSGEKLWDDFDNRLDSRPEAITIVLLQNGEAYLDPQEVTADTNNQWIYSFTDLPKYDELGEAYEYTIEELAVEGYETSYGDNVEILNTLIPAISVSVGDYVWFDANKDGLQDDTDVPIAGVVLTIENEDGSPVTDIEGLPVGPQITDENGHYSFDKLPADAIYIVRIDRDASAEALKNYVPTLDETGDDHSIDSSTWSATSRHLVEDEERDPTLDFGFVLKKVSVGDYVWIDENKDGLQDETDTPLAGVVLTITTKDGEPVTDINGKPVGPTTTDENGWYTFENLPANETYVVTIGQAASSEALKGLKPTLVNEGDNSEIDSSLWSETSRHLTEDEERDPTLDFGFVRKQVSVGDYVWEDVNRDGLQDDTDIPLAGVVLTITTKDGKPVTDVNGDPVGPTTTDENGWYTFDNLPADETYVVTIDQAASSEALKGLKPTLSNVGDNSEIDSSLWSETSRHLTEDEERDPTLDFGFVRPRVSVGDYVWFDKNKDGIQDADEKGIANVILEIVDKDGNPVMDVFGNPVEPTTTDENGYYSFDDLPIDNTYRVRVRRDQPVLDGYTPTKHEQGNDNSVDSSTWEATSRHLTEDEERDPTLDFGFYVPKGSVGDYVWFDANNDGLQDATDVPLKGVVLTIEDEQGNPVTDIFGNVVQPVTTDENGYYIFDNLPLGHRYTVRIDQAASADVLKDYQTALEEQGNDNSIDSSTWFTTSVLLEVDGQHDPTLDFGFVKKPGEKTPDKPGKPGEKLPETGEESFAWLAGIVLVLGGTLLYFGNRKRRKN